MKESLKNDSYVSSWIIGRLAIPFAEKDTDFEIKLMTIAACFLLENQTQLDFRKMPVGNLVLEFRREVKLKRQVQSYLHRGTT